MVDSTSTVLLEQNKRYDIKYFTIGHSSKKTKHVRRYSQYVIT